VTTQRSRFLAPAALLGMLLLSAPLLASGGNGGGDDGGGGNGGGHGALTLRVNPAIGAPGGTVAMVLRTYAPRPIRQGQISIRVVRRPRPGAAAAAALSGLTLEALTQPVRPLTLLSVVVYSPQNDALTQGLLNALPDSQLARVTFQSPSASVNSADGPLAVFRFHLDPSVQPGDVFDLSLDGLQTSLADAAGRAITLAPRGDTLTVRAPSAPFRVEAAGDKVQPGAVAELGVNTYEPFLISGGRVTLTWNPALAGGPPTVKLDPRYGRSTFTVNTAKPGRLVVDFKSPDTSFNSVPGTIVAISLPISAAAAIGSTSPFTLDPKGTYFLNRRGKRIPVALKSGAITIQ
jgi:hypothetical protein